MRTNERSSSRRGLLEQCVGLLPASARAVRRPVAFKELLLKLPRDRELLLKLLLLKLPGDRMLGKLAKLAAVDVQQACSDCISSKDPAEAAGSDAVPAVEYLIHDALSVLVGQGGQGGQAGHAGLAMRAAYDMQAAHGDTGEQPTRALVKKRSGKRCFAYVDGSVDGPDATLAQKEGRDGSACISVEQIQEMYALITTQTTKNRKKFTFLLKTLAKKFGVSITSLRNILSFKNRREDSHTFWNDDLWQLYNESVRCETCRQELPPGSRVLCRHFGRGRPSIKNKHKEVTVTRHRKSSAVQIQKKESNNGLIRAYVVQICINKVWATFGCSDSKSFLLAKKDSTAIAHKEVYIYT